MVGVLRAKDGVPETEPTKGTDRLEDLVAYLQEAGVEARIDEAGYDRLRVPTYVDVALYDIARETTTNIVRHAQARTAAIRIAGEEACVRLTVEDDGIGAANVQEGAAPIGHGIEGMTERAHLLGGTLEAAPRFGGGFRVMAVLPVPERGEAQ